MSTMNRTRLAPADLWLYQHARAFTIGGLTLILLGAVTAGIRRADHSDLNTQQKTIDLERRHVQAMPKLQRNSAGRDPEGGLDVVAIGEPQKTPEQLNAEVRLIGKQLDLDIARNNRTTGANIQLILGLFTAFLGVVAIVSATVATSKMKRLSVSPGVEAGS